MIKKFLLIGISFIILSGCNLAIGFFDSTFSDDTESESTPEPPSIPTGEPTPELTAVPTEEPTPVPTIVPTPLPDPVVLYENFETSFPEYWDGEFLVIQSAAHTGSFGARITSPDYISLNIAGLTPDIEYVLSLWTRFRNIPGEGHVTIQYCEDEYTTVSMINDNTDWNHLSIPFTPCNGLTEVTITIFCTAANVDVDDIILECTDIE